MIVIKIAGGTGNQMFQYAFGQYLKYKYEYTVEYNIDFFQMQPSHLDKRNFELGKIFPDLVLNHNIFIKEFNKKKGLAKLSYLIFGLLFRYQHSFFPLSEKFCRNIHVFKKFFPRLYLVGFWQDKRFADWLIQHGLFRYAELAADKKYEISKYPHASRVAIGVRRGDFVELGVASDIYYFETSIHHIRSMVKHPVFFVFSDDIPWCKKTFSKIEVELVYVEKNDESPFCNILIMSLCCHYILSKSTFDWWGAYLNEAENGIVITPESWKLGTNLGSDWRWKRKCRTID